MDENLGVFWQAPKKGWSSSLALSALGLAHARGKIGFRGQAVVIIHKAVGVAELLSASLDKILFALADWRLPAATFRKVI